LARNSATPPPKKIPSPEALAQLGARPVTLSVIEPHPVAVDYLAFPAPVVISAALGPEWEAKTKTIEFRALDGYVSRIDVTRLGNGKAQRRPIALHGRQPNTERKERSAGPVLPYLGQQRRPGLALGGNAELAVPSDRRLVVQRI
jgi:hypothetical protein